MERVTQKDERGYYLVGDGIYSDWGVPEKFRGDDVDRLASIEDILGDEYDLDRSGIIDGAKSLLGIASPSKVFAGIGENMALGLRGHPHGKLDSGQSQRLLPPRACRG